MTREEPPQDRRRAPRHRVEGVAGTLRLSSSAEILNISLTGMAARTSMHLRVGQRCDLRLERSPHSLRLAGTVVWARLVSFGKTAGGESAPVYELGLEFQDMLSDLARALLALLGETAVISVQTRVAGRFVFPPGAPANLEAAAELLVREISTKGALVETAIRPDPDQALALTLDLGDAGALGCRGRVAYVRSGEGAEADLAGAENAPVLVGIEFTGLEADEREKLDAFIGEHLA